MSDACTSDYKQRPPAAFAGSRVSRWTVLAALGATALALALVYARRPVEAPAAAAPNLILPTKARVARGDVARDDAVAAIAPRAAPVGAASPSPLRVQFEQAPDLFAYAQSIRSRAEAGEPEAIWLLSRVYDYCANYSSAPVDYAADTRAIEAMKLRTSAAMAGARQRVSDRCARFAPEDGLNYQLVFLKRVEAAQAGSLPAEASLLASGKPLEKTEEYRANLVDRVLRSKDPEAYSALAPGMGIVSSGRRSGSSRLAGTQFAELAWQLAACQLGQDCSSNGSLMTSYCANGGICSQDPTQDFAGFVYDAAIPRQGAEVVDEMVESLVGEKRTAQ
ncbi:hypothetical protein [Lysobacter firmicutimachus]|uniref:Secreted protein n=1 Tax=Lysobacter firmicutimachus TaxID=1792846 RepID=A0ABU8D6S2_9GAMM